MKFVAQLKEGTKDIHARLDAHPWLAGLMNSPTRTDYGAFLAVWASILTEVERVVHPILTSLSTELRLADRRRAAQAWEDLLMLGLDPGAKKPTPCDQKICVSSVEGALGAMYVVEGSTLGGAVVKMRIQANATFTPVPFAFLDGYGELRVRYWKECVGVIESFFEKHPEGFAQALQGARATFEWVEAQFNSAAKNRRDSAPRSIPLGSALSSLGDS